MSNAGSSGGSGLIFWIIVAPLVIGTLSTFAFIAWSYTDHAHNEAADKNAAEARSLDTSRKMKNLCEAYRRLARPGAAEPTAKEVLDSVSTPEGLDAWGRALEFQPWDHSMRSFGPDMTRGTADDVLVSCVSHE